MKSTFRTCKKKTLWEGLNSSWSLSVLKGLFSIILRTNRSNTIKVIFVFASVKIELTDRRLKKFSVWRQLYFRIVKLPVATILSKVKKGTVTCYTSTKSWTLQNDVLHCGTRWCCSLFWKHNLCLIVLSKHAEALNHSFLKQDLPQETSALFVMANSATGRNRAEVLSSTNKFLIP